MSLNRGRRLAVAIAAGLALFLATGARAGNEQPRVRDRANYFQVTLPSTWQRVTPAPGPEKVLLAAHNRRPIRTLAITRIAYPNPKRKKTSFHDQVEDGLRSTVPDYKRLQRRNLSIKKVPVMDLVFRRKSASGQREVVWMRFLFFRTFTLNLSLAAPAENYRRVARRTRALIRSFQPYFAD